MRTRPTALLIRLAAPAARLVLAACAPAPIYKTTGAAVTAAPFQVAQSPENFSNSAVIGGGRIVQVKVIADHREIELQAYPLDASQRPKADDSGNGRYIAGNTRYVERLAYPAGALLPTDAKKTGTRARTDG